MGTGRRDRFPVPNRGRPKHRSEAESTSRPQRVNTLGAVRRPEQGDRFSEQSLEFALARGHVVMRRLLAHVRQPPVVEAVKTDLMTLVANPKQKLRVLPRPIDEHEERRSKSMPTQFVQHLGG